MTTEHLSLFGTDGIRGEANLSPMTPDHMVRLAQAAGSTLIPTKHRPVVVIGKDTRLSGYMIETALTAGFISVGMDVVLVGPMPTPALSMLTKSLRADMGVVISASHNPYQDNGVKFFGPEGLKLTAAEQTVIETRFYENNLSHLVSSSDLGTARRMDDAAGRYIEYVKNTFPRGMRLDGLKIVIDAANGAAYKIAPLVLWELGAEIIPMGVKPNGRNINDMCGATSPSSMVEAVHEHRADLGIALDGDADRVILSDEMGRIIDGDALIGAIAQFWKSQGLLRGRGAVGTIMTNLGLEQFLNSLDLTLHRTPVGDRHVKEKMMETGCNVGGESSGHIILSDYVGTGDGLVAALQFLAMMVVKQKPASVLGQPYLPVPQLSKNIRVPKPDQLLCSDHVQKVLDDCRQELGSSGRIVVRKSGTEPLIRLMVESTQKDMAEKIMQKLTEAFKP